MIKNRIESHANEIRFIYKIKVLIDHYNFIR